MANRASRILVVDDESAIREGLKALLEEDGYYVVTVDSGLKAWEQLQVQSFNLVLVDLMLPELTGLELLEKIRNNDIPTEVIIITGKGTIDTAVEAIKTGAYDYLTKPVASDRLLTIIPKALAHNQLVIAHRGLEAKIKHLTHYEDLIGQSPQMLEIYQLIDAVADSTANVIITGESGTGKELVARAIHNKSNRNKGPFIGVNCAAFPKDILENELFGHEKGAFTGALNEKQGCFELADHGTLFLDEIGEMAIETQPKILRALEERRFRRLGGKKEINVDVRVVAATNRNLKEAVEQRLLREDLYYRLCVVEIDMPPLRERISDIPLLINEFIELFSRMNQKRITGITSSCHEVLLRYHWPGNVRELKNVIERAVVLTTNEQIDTKNLPRRLFDNDSDEGGLNFPIGTPIQQVEKKMIFGTLAAVNNNKTRAAKILGISLKTLHNKLAVYKKHSD
ncbi:sigma-54-dependent Fis family transcriptional regulator [candidate division KSB1 bacterium]|nr:sigma-54-dependent Fis family transcriptional regulator [candidate division KSB1 bacterium]